MFITLEEQSRQDDKQDYNNYYNISHNSKNIFISLNHPNHCNYQMETESKESIPNMNSYENQDAILQANVHSSPHSLSPASISSPSLSNSSTNGSVSISTILSLEREQYILSQFQALLSASTVDISKLSKLSWNGIPAIYRSMVWQLLLGYLPAQQDRRHAFLLKRRSEYHSITRQHFTTSNTATINATCMNNANNSNDENANVNKNNGNTDSGNQSSSSLNSNLNTVSIGPSDATMHQIKLDVPRTCPEIPLFRNKVIQESLERILYCWSIRRPSSGYVQGIADLATPIYEVFLLGTDKDSSIVESNGLLMVVEDRLWEIEADVFWCFTKLLDSIQDCFTPNQTGILRQIKIMREILLRTDIALIAHLEKMGLDLVQCSFRWMNCLLIREFPLHIIIRMWDTYLSEGFAEFHIYVCAAFMSYWSKTLREMNDYQDVLLFLQAPPTGTWSRAEIETLLSEAYILKSLFHNSYGHLRHSAIH